MRNRNLVQSAFLCFLALTSCNKSTTTEGDPAAKARNTQAQQQQTQPSQNQPNPKPQTPREYHCGYLFQEDSLENAQVILKRLQGRWEWDKGLMYQQGHFVKFGFEVSIETTPGKYGIINYIYDTTLETQTLRTVTSPGEPLTHLRMSLPLTDGRYAGYRVMETYSESSDFCSTWLFSLEDGPNGLLHMRGPSWTSGGVQDLNQLINSSLSPLDLHRY